MDSLTHIVLGGCLGHITLGKKVGRKAVVWGAIADTIPDLDIFYGLMIHPIDSLLVHRGFTHSIFFAIIASLGLGYFLSKWYHKDGASAKEWILLMALGLFSHLFIDSLTSYGTGLLEPFCNHRFSYTTIFIADPAFTSPMLFSFIGLLIKRVNTHAKSKLAIGALIISSLYLLWTLRNRLVFEKYFHKEYSAQALTIHDHVLSPAPLNNVLWGTMAKTDSGYYSGFNSLLNLDSSTRFHFISSNKHLVPADIQKQREYMLLERFSKGYNCISISADGWPYFHDLRFGTATGWSDTIGGFTFKYPLKRDIIDTTHLIHYNPWRSEWEGTRGLWDKIWGR